MAPESIENKTYSKKSDVFSFGVVMYEVLTQRAPWDQYSGVLVASKVIHKERMELSTEIPSTLKELMHKCWEHNPADRPTFKKTYKILLSCFATKNDVSSTPPPLPPHPTYVQVPSSTVPYESSPVLH